MEPGVLPAVCDAAQGQCQALQGSDGAASQQHQPRGIGR